MLKILIVEDDPAVGQLVAQFLEGEGFLSAATTDVPGAWRVLSEEAPDAAVIDLALPGGESGWDLIEDVRRSEALMDMPIVVLTGSPAEEVIERARGLRCVYLGKPFSSAALLDRLQIAIRRVGRGLATRPWEVVLLTSTFRIEGTVHTSAELARFSDAWEALARDPRSYVPVTHARVVALSDGSEVVGSELLEVRKDRIALATPREEASAGATA